MCSLYLLIGFASQLSVTPVFKRRPKSSSKSPSLLLHLAGGFSSDPPPTKNRHRNIPLLTRALPLNSVRGSGPLACVDGGGAQVPLGELCPLSALVGWEPFVVALLCPGMRGY